MGQDLAGKVAIVTGGTGGIGKASVELFIEHGAKVVIADVNRDKGEALAAALGKNARFKQTDVSQADEVQSLVDYAVAEFGGLHVMFNNAGISGHMVPSLLDEPLDDFQRVMGVNLFGVMVGTQRAARHMAKHGGGSIINNSSTSGILPCFGAMVYRSSKAAIIMFSKSAAIDLGQHGIRVNALTPGYIDTELNAFSAPGIPPEVAEKLAKAVQEVKFASQPLKRIGLTRDAAEAALFLASDRSSYTTGTVLSVDGGVTAGDPVNHMQQFLDARKNILGG